MRSVHERTKMVQSKNRQSDAQRLREPMEFGIDAASSKRRTAEFKLTWMSTAETTLAVESLLVSVRAGGSDGGDAGDSVSPQWQLGPQGHSESPDAWQHAWL